MACEKGSLSYKDQKWMRWLEGLDTERTMDFVLFRKVGYRYILPSATFESVQKRVEMLREREDVKGLPPLDVIFYDDLVETAWGWDRLLPWKNGFLLFEDYFVYLEKFYRKNKNSVYEHYNLSVSDGPASLNVAAAIKCKETEEKLNALITGNAGMPEIAQLHCQQSQQILNQALDLMEQGATLTTPAGSILPAACFLCITQEARLILALSNMKNDVLPVEVWQMKFEFGCELRQAALDILINYRGPHFEQISAAILGMAKEFSFACDLLDPEKDFEYCDEVSDISHEIRIFLLELLLIIRKTFPLQSAINYDPIEHFRTARKNKHTRSVNNCHFDESSLNYKKRRITEAIQDIYILKRRITGSSFYVGQLCFLRGKSHQ